ncbi:hypothetical protein DCC81_22905 [Chitinophaga parva]|uniref:DUF2568 domain-containing protein n=1 Tax=Chitinophaga parva TaxID=2169414 RepID=A0A2T7BDU3_9BACT|nr:YrdB family protein [Chitinophaga parva]PUZ23247.1 hypothetical protein DCC81_22905 [Chitinophaga parva]
MQILKNLNLVLKFAIELVMLGAFAYAGWIIPQQLAWKIIVPLVLLTVVILLWGRVAAPKSPTRLPFAKRVAFGLAMFMLAAVALYVAGQPVLALVYAGIVLLCETGTIVWRQ